MGSCWPSAKIRRFFSILGTTYGGNGVNNFALPDLRGRAPLHSGQLSGGSSYNLGQSAGQEGVTLQTNEIPPHNHQVMAASGNGTANTPQNNVWAASAQGDNQYAPNRDTVMNPGAIALTGGNQPHNNMQPSLSLMMVIALVGAFPPRS